MYSKKPSRLMIVIGLALAVNVSDRAHAQEFYKDKTVAFIVGYSPGGSFDQYTRLIARHFGKHIPGAPTTVVQNMTGASGIIAANTHGYQFVFSLPPGTPSDRLKLLQDGFIKTLKDPELLAEAKKAQMEIDPTDGPTLTKAFASLYDLSPSMIAKLKDILLAKK